MLILAFFSLVSSDLISSSNIESCLDWGNSTATCSKSLVVSLSIENSQSANTESLSATLTSVFSGNSSLPLRYPIKITLAKSAVKARYPLNYLQDFNNKAKELLVSCSVFDCSDGPNSSNPTCGWKYDSLNKRIWDSQGYCCKCDFLDFLGVDPNSYQRGYACQAFNLGSGSATAFCLVWDDLWYSSYEILQYDISYTISVTITSADSNGNYTSNTYDLSPSVPTINKENILIKLIGDFAPSNPPPSFESKVLFTPSKPLNNYKVLVGSPYWMAIDKSMITFDGTECNKVGTSYTGFRGQPNKCGMPVNSCFSNQLNDLHSSDTTRQTNGQLPFYLISRYGNFSIVTTPNQRYLDLALQGSYPSLITLQMNADSIQFITTISKGVIDMAEITNFEALTLDGTLLAQVSNIGNIISKFTVSIICSNGVSPISAIPLSLGVMESRRISTGVQVINEKLGEYQCNVTLLDSIGNVNDLKTVEFNTSDRHTDQGTQGGSGKRPNGVSGVNKTDTNLSCSEYCPAWYDLFCFVSKGCWGNFFGFFGIVIGIVVVLIALKFIIKRYGICCQKCCPDSEPAVQPRRAENTNETVIEVKKIQNLSDSENVKKKRCFYNSSKNFERFQASKPVSIPGIISYSSTGYKFEADNGEIIDISVSEAKKCISKHAKYSTMIK